MTLILNSTWTIAALDYTGSVVSLAGPALATGFDLDAAFRDVELGNFDRLGALQRDHRDRLEAVKSHFDYAAQRTFEEISRRQGWRDFMQRLDGRNG